MTVGIKSRVTAQAVNGLTNYFKRSRLLVELMCAGRPSSCWRKGENRRSGLVGHGLEGKMKKKTLLLWASLLVVLTLEGCATLRGMGEDIQSLGRALKRAVSG